ncbi:DUF2125 domain-containing protein [Aureimonas sp. AU12]|uniref:DUF2125 domain-containing protein n=1 Tax=Aureimonas sp. AU12 TaxID=1638161 RepID=UPI000AC19575|nr:DUF2125 domain-containing protein [Aureimonas sp. AU12]
MASSRSGTPRRKSAASRVFAAVFGLVVVLAVVLTAGWFYLAHELDRRVASLLDAAAGGGTTIECGNREVFGYPFRLGVSCDALAVEAPANGIKVTGGALHTASQIYQPSRIVAELASPVAVDAPDLPPIELRWTLAQASTSLWTQGLERVSVAIDQPQVILRGGDGAPFARSDRLEFHARQNGAGLDLVLTDAGVTATLPGIPPLPPFDVAVDMTVDGAADWLRSGLPGGQFGPALRGEAGTVRALRLSLPGGGLAELSGPFRVAEGGEISGDFRLSVENPQAIAGLIGVLVPGTGGLAQTVAGAIGFTGRQENGRTVIDFQVRDGEARLGFIPLGRLPRI